MMPDRTVKDPTTEMILDNVLQRSMPEMENLRLANDLYPGLAQVLIATAVLPSVLESKFAAANLTRPAPMSGGIAVTGRRPGRGITQAALQGFTSKAQRKLGDTPAIARLGLDGARGEAP